MEGVPMSESPALSPAHLYWRIFVRTGIPFGFAVGLWIGFLWSWHSEFARALAAGALCGGLGGLLFGASMSATVGTIAVRATRNLGRGALAVHQHRVVEVAATPQEVIERVRGAVARLPNAHPPKLDASGASVETITGVTWQSWGEVVTAHVHDGAPGKTRVHLECRPRIHGTVVDYGKAYKNVEAVVATLEGGPPRPVTS